MATIKLEGMLFPAFFPEENFYLVKNMPLRDEDIVVTTYPKCGTNWTVYIVYCLLHPEEPAPSAERIKGFCPFVDYMGFKSWKDSPEDMGRIMMTHFPFDYLRWNSSTKFIPVIRNPFDCCVSLYHFQKQMPSCVLPDGSGQEIPTEFFSNFMNGNVIYGDYFKHLKVLYERKDEPNVHLVVFEKLKANPREEILNLARFLGKEEKLLANDGELLDKIVEKSSFSSMKRNVIYKSADDKPLNILRKGEVGGYRDSLTSDQIKTLKDKLEKELNGTEFLNFWRDI